MSRNEILEALTTGPQPCNHLKAGQHVCSFVHLLKVAQINSYTAGKKREAPLTGQWVLSTLTKAPTSARGTAMLCDIHLLPPNSTEFEEKIKRLLQILLSILNYH